MLMIKRYLIMREIKILVRNLVEYMLRSGDIDNRFQSMSRALEGRMLPRITQRHRGAKVS